MGLASLLFLGTLLPAAPLLATEPGAIVPEPLGAPVTLEVQPAVPAARDTASVASAAAAVAPAATAAAPAATQANRLRGRADAAANATLAALLPHLSRNDGMLLDRSANFAGDMNRLLSGETADARPEGRLEQVVKSAMGLLGTPYRWGGTGPDGFDCSGL